MLTLLRTVSDSCVKSGTTIIPHVVTCSHHISTDCDIHLKVIYSQPGDEAQLEHTDIIEPYVQLIPQDRRKYHYSVIVPISPHTKLHVQQELINIPVDSMIIFRGDTPHAGAAYQRHNHRLFISIAHALFPVRKSVGLVK